MCVCRFTHTVRALLGTFAHLICVPSLHTAADANATAADAAAVAAASVVLNSNSYEAFIINAFDLKYAHDGGISTLNRGSWAREYAIRNLFSVCVCVPS